MAYVRGKGELVGVFFLRRNSKGRIRPGTGAYESKNRIGKQLFRIISGELCADRVKNVRLCRNG